MIVTLNERLREFNPPLVARDVARDGRCFWQADQLMRQRLGLDAEITNMDEDPQTF